MTIKFEVVDITARSRYDYSVTSSEVTLLSGERKKDIPIDIIDDITPELSETFRVRLLNQISGEAVLGDLIESVITINASDNPHGNFGKNTNAELKWILQNICRPWFL